MSSLKPRETQLGNRLLAALPRAEHERLLPFFELVRLTPGKILYDVGDTVRHAYFPKGGMISLLSITEDGKISKAKVLRSGSELGSNAPFSIASL